MSKTEETVRDFLGFLGGQICKPPEWSENLKLLALQIENCSANDYYREPKDEEVERLIAAYLKTRHKTFRCLKRSPRFS